MPFVAKITSKGQVTVPAELRAQMDLAPGDRLRFTVDDGGTVRVEKATVSLSDLRDALSDLPRLTPNEAVEAVEEARKARAGAVSGEVTGGKKP